MVRRRSWDSIPTRPEALRQSAEADIAPVTAVEMVDVIDAHLGELSRFHETYGFYVHGVSIDAAILPAGWKRRAVEVRNENTRNATGWCVEAHDLAVSKLVAFRDKDRDFVRILLLERLVQSKTLIARLGQLPRHPRVTPELLERVTAWIKGAARDIRSST